ncbi:MAG: phosphate signaling complex protein PhoU [Planctomycetota bacterium]|nr:phosphate signaling complex protein PhoU [Planctomycetota bacterium]
MSMHLFRDLEQIHHDILSMCAQVEEIIHQAVDELWHPNLDTAAALARKDDEIDAWDVRIEENCLKTLALHQPVASDLRRIATVLKLTGELERIADLGVNIAERGAALADGPQIVVPDKLKKMAKLAVDMVHRSIDAYVETDCQVARDVCAADDEVDDLNREIIDGLQAVMKESPDFVAPALHLFSASRHIERVADHATNIAEDVVYLIEGDIIRHQHTTKSTDK